MRVKFRTDHAIVMVRALRGDAMVVVVKRAAAMGRERERCIVK